MIFLNPEAQGRLARFRLGYACGDYSVVADFDNTISEITCPSSQKAIQLLRGEDTPLAIEFTALRTQYNPSRPASEWNSMLEKVSTFFELYTRQFALFAKHGVTEEEILLAAAQQEHYRCRPGWPELLERAERDSAPVCILSCGMGNCVEEMLRLWDCAQPHQVYLNNKLRVEAGRVTGFEPIHLCEPYKSERFRQLVADGGFAPKGTVLVCGDQLHDFELASLLDEPLRVGYPHGFAPEALYGCCDILLEKQEDIRTILSE